MPGAEQAFQHVWMENHFAGGNNGFALARRRCADSGHSCRSHPRKRRELVRKQGKRDLGTFAAPRHAEAETPRFGWAKVFMVMKKLNGSLFASAQTVPTGVRRIGANLSPMAKIDGLDERINADIAILDTGITPHPDLNLFTSVSFIAGQTSDGNGHGTHVAGIAAALDNDIGVVGVAPGARLWAIKVMDDSGSGITSTVIQGIDYVTQNASQIEVANLSLVGIGNSSALRLA